ncbi:hypothetical protein CHS0354_009500 [Potamilus streckersoni]|uniref:Uncharacterized protein n=1 Tax=Potamilus streckersoni TaxID=2493646 RepID=A0AAE0VJU4_9BIVA|nr:hypothetical protein CHS0354_009500 [Potamilus streckersoni]
MKMISQCMLRYIYLVLVFIASAMSRPKSASTCPDGSPMVRCFVNPCDMTDCPAYPGANCVANYCAGCNADYYVHGKKVDCNDRSDSK